MGDRLLRACGGAGLSWGNDVLAQFVFAQLQPLSPRSFRLCGSAFDEGNILSQHRMSLQLLDKMVARRGVEGHAKNAAGVLVEAANRQRFELTISSRQRFSCYAAVPSFEFPGQKVSENAQCGKVAVGCRHRDESGTLIDDGEGGIH